MHSAKQITELLLEKYSALLGNYFFQLQYSLENPLDSDLDVALNRYATQALLERERSLRSTILEKAELHIAGLLGRRSEEGRGAKRLVHSGIHRTMRLIDEEELELQIELSNLTSIVLFKYKNAVSEFDIHIQNLAGGYVRLENNPVHPSVMCSWFKSALVECDVELMVNLTCTKSYIQFLKAQFGHFIVSCNNVFTRHTKAEPVYQEDVVLNAFELDQESRCRSRRQAIIQDISGVSCAGLGAQADFQDGLQSLVDNLRDVREFKQHCVMAEAKRQLADKEELCVSLAALPLRSTLPVKSLIEEIGGLIAKKGRALNHHDTAALSLVSIVFSELYQNADIPDQVKLIMSDLRIPFARAAILDDAFLNDDDSPALNLLNALAHAGATWYPYDRQERGALYTKMRAIVSRLVEEFEDDYIVFEQAHDELKNFLAPDQKRFRIVQRRVIGKEAARARMEKSRQIASSHITQNFSEVMQQAPILKMFFSGTWQQVLFFIYNKYESFDCEYWKKAVELETQLFCLDLNTPQSMKLEFKNSLLELFEFVGLSVAQANTWYENLITVMSTLNHERRHHNLKINAAVDTCNLSCESELVEKMGMGTWLQPAQSYASDKLRVASYLKASDTFVLVHRDGTFHSRLPRKTMESYVATGYFKVLELGMMYESTLEAVISQQSRAKAEPVMLVDKGADQNRSVDFDAMPSWGVLQWN